MESNKKPTYQELEKRIDELLSKKNEAKSLIIKQDYRRIFDNATISIWNEDFSLVFEQINELRKLEIPDIKIYLEQNPEVLASLLSKLKVNSVNRATLKLFKAKRDQEFLNNIQNTFGDGADKVFVDIIESIWNNEKSFTSEVNYKTLKGDQFAALISIPIPQTEAEQRTVPVTIQSIQQLKEAEIAKTESLKKLEQAQKIGRIGSWEWQPESDLAVWSDEMYRIYGVEKDEFEPTSENVGKKILEEDRHKMEHAINQLSNEGIADSFEFRIVRPNNEIRYVCILALQKSEGTVFGLTQDITEQKLLDSELIKAKEKAEESEAYLNNIINNIGDPVFVKDDKFRMVLVNDSFCKLLGFPKNKIIGKTMVEDLPAQQMEGFLKIDNQVLSSGVENLNEEVITNASGIVLTIITKKSRYIDEQNNSFVIGTIRDITEAKVNQQELDSQSKRIYDLNTELNEAQKLSHIGNWEYIIDNDNVTWSKELFNIFERSPDLGAPNYSEQESLYTKESFAILDQAVINCVEHEIPYDIELEIYTSNGATKHIISKGNFKKDKDNKIVSCYGTAQDITQRKLIQKELDSQNEKLNDLNNALNEAQSLAKIGSWSFYLLTKKIEWSDETFHLWGFDPKKSAPEFDVLVSRIHKDDQELFNRVVDAALRLGTPYDIEHRISFPNGDQKVIRAICKPVFGATGEVTSLVGTSQDISSHKQFEQAQVKHQRLKAMGEMSASIAHDFNNSLQEMMGNLEIMKFQKDLSGSTLEHLSNIGSIINDAADRVSALQKFSDTEHADKNAKPLDFNTLIEESLNQSRPLWKDAMEKEGLKINVFTEFEEIPKIHCNRGELKSAVYNLIKNSIEAMPKGGDLIIKTGLKANGVYATFTDTGIGMNEETKSKIFEPFFTKKGFKLGRGLGMSGVYSIVNKYKGDIIVAFSELDKGTSIELVFPISVRDEIKVLEKNEPNKEVSFSALWVDDDAIISKSSALMVESIGHKCFTVNKGKRALDYLNNNHCDIVFTDIGMPNMNGWELAEAIRKKYGNKIIIVAVTGWNIEEKVKEEHGIDFFMQKPFSMADIKKIFTLVLA